jgi:hypothetical protein
VFPKAVATFSKQKLGFIPRMLDQSNWPSLRLSNVPGTSRLSSDCGYLYRTQSSTYLPHPLPRGRKRSQGLDPVSTTLISYRNANNEQSQGNN